MASSRGSADRHSRDDSHHHRSSHQQSSRTNKRSRDDYPTNDDDDDDHQYSSSTLHRHRHQRDEGRDRDTGKSRDREVEKDRHSDRNKDKHSEKHRERTRDRDGRKSHRHKDSESSSRRQETSQERRQRKAAKKSQSKNNDDHDFESFGDQDEAAQRAAMAELIMYSAQDNPFNDANLGQKFRWAKKEEKDRTSGLSKDEAEKRDRQRRQEAMAEIEKLNAKRAEREKQAVLREEEEARMARLAESAQMAEWVAKEDDFHLEQVKRRAAIRVRENRAKPIDLLSINLKWADPTMSHEPTKDHTDMDQDEDDEAGLEIDLEEPYHIFENLPIQETEELHQDIQMYLALEKNQANLDFWRSMIIVCDDKLNELKEAEGQEANRLGYLSASRTDPAEKERIKNLLSSKSTNDLLELQEQVRAKLASGEPVDVEYWERVLKAIVVWRAKTKLRNMHEVVLSNRIEYLQRKQRDEALRQQHNLLHQLGQDPIVEGQSSTGQETQLPLSSEVDIHDTEEARFERFYDSDEMEPAPVDVLKLRYEERQIPIVSLEQDHDELIKARRRVLNVAFIPRSRANNSQESQRNDDPAENLYRQEASKALDVEEEIFNTDVDLARQTYQWEDKYRPRKPRYFNRVHTGFEWNKYNQTHYDSDNPPPKTVQGYKFNIFYPDLIDKTVAPTYKIIKEPGNSETVLLRFTAGPPYEDIAFRVINREWEYSHRRGFRSSFDRGVLQLHFNFKRMRYRK